MDFQGGGRRLLVGYTEDRAKKDAYNREKGIRRLEKAYRHGALTKRNTNKRGYNKFLSMDGVVRVAINYDRIADDERWDGLKGYLTNTDIRSQDIYTAYHNLWHVERAFRIAKSKIEIRPMPHFTRKRIEAHVCICFVALKLYKELERMLKVSEIKMSVDKVPALAKTITTIQIRLPPKQRHLYANDANGKAPKNRKTLRRRFLEYAMTKSGKTPPQRKCKKSTRQKTPSSPPVA